MDREKAIRFLKIEQSADDVEEGHIEADKVLCELLKALGYEDVVTEWNKVLKWYV